MRVSLPLIKIGDMEVKLVAINILDHQKSLLRAEVSLSDEVDANPPQPESSGVGCS